MQPPWGKRLLAGITLLVVVVLGIHTAYRAGPYDFGGKRWGSAVHHSDFTVYQLAGQAVLKGTDIYEVRNQRGWAYVYPPPFAILMVPFALMSVLAGAVIWYLISLALAAWAVQMCVGMVREEYGLGRNTLAVAVVPTFLLGVWIWVGLARGQASVAMLWLVVAAVFWQRKGHQITGAACLAGATLLKAFPLLLLAYFIWRRRWRFVAATMGALVVGAVLLPAAVFGWQKNLSYLREWEQTVAKPAMVTETTRANYYLYEQLLSWEKPRNQSLPPVLYRLLHWLGVISGETNTWFLVAWIGLIMAAAIWLAGRRERPDRELLVISAVIVWMLLVSPMAEDHYFVILLLPLTVAVAVVIRAADETMRRITVIGLTVFAALNVACVIYRPFELYGAITCASVILFALILLLMRRGRPGLMEPAGGNSLVREAAIPPSAAPVSPSVSLVLPMFNESESVDWTLAQTLDSLGRNFSDFEIVVADDASTDSSAEQVERWAAKDPRIRLVRLARNQRFGGALRAGMAAAQKEFLFYTDFDLPIALDCLPALIREFAEGDVLTGLAATQMKYASRASKLISRGYNFLVRAGFGLSLQDINFGFKAMRKSVWDQLALRSRSPFADAELFIEARRLGYRIKEVELPFSLRQIGVSRIRRLDVILWTLFDMAWLRVALLRRRAKPRRTETKRLLVINADDFGLDPGINAAVAQAHRQGILTSASLIITAPHAAEAIEFARSHPRLGTGLHLCLVDGRPAAPPEQMNGLLDSRGQLPSGPLGLSAKLSFGRRSIKQAIENEVVAQIEQFLATGLRPTHLDTHMHVHLDPRVLKIIVKVAREYNINFVRSPVESLGCSLRSQRRGWARTLLRWMVFATLGRGSSRRLRRLGVRTTDRAVGVLNPGQLTEDFLAAYLRRLPGGLTEMLFHPAMETSAALKERQPHYRHLGELQALCSPQLRQLIEAADINLTNFREI